MSEQQNRFKWTAGFFFVFFLAVGLLTAHNINEPIVRTVAEDSLYEKDLYTNGVQKVFNSRCIACHSCFDSPCQLNLQAYEGLARGLTAKDVYDAARSEAVTPTRLFEDAKTTEQWRALGFHDVIGNMKSSVLLNAVVAVKRTLPTLPASKSRSCNNQDNQPELNEHNSQLAMPYGMSAISYEDTKSIFDWISEGAKPPRQKNPVGFSAGIVNQVQSWTKFLNQSDLKSKLLSRYLFEHLYLAHLYFQEAPSEYLKLIRSSQSCESPSIIATKHASESPGAEKFYYCFVKEQSTIVSKTHLPYKLSYEKLEWIKKNFYSENWSVSQLPSYSAEVSANPFEAFKEMPVKARYQFLIEDAQYHIMTFIKGPVCNGTNAVNSIQEQFYVFFMAPESDIMVRSTKTAESIRQNVILPGEFGSNVKVGDLPKNWVQYAKRRDIYADITKQELKNLSPEGLGLHDLWDGNGKNDNAVLTVFRHDDNAAVVKGARGDLSKTAFVLDYSTFERLCYNLVINFNVFGNVGHQALTRLYMDILRMDSEDNFLNFFPPNQRIEIKKSWYDGGFFSKQLTQKQLDYLKEFDFPDIPSKITLSAKTDSASDVKVARVELIQKILFERMNAKVRGPDDVINWKKIAKTEAHDEIDNQLKKIASIPGSEMPFSQYFPEVSYLIITNSDSNQNRVYTLIHNIEHDNVAWVITGKRVPDEDTLTIERGIFGSYPNLFFNVATEDVPDFVQLMSKIKSETDYKKFAKKYGVNRMDPKIWTLYDIVTQDFSKTQPEMAGFIDLSRYEFQEKKISNYGISTEFYR